MGLKEKIKLDIKREKFYYDILIGNNYLNSLSGILKTVCPANKYAVITDDNVYKLYGKNILRQFSYGKLKTEIFVMPHGEKSKNINEVIRISSEMLERGFDRKSAIIALGGGVVGDLAGFIASVLMRGIPYIQIPTTLIAQVDSSIGGKTGINLKTGKNLIGSFCQPACVLIDISFLSTLPKKEFVNGLAEVIKYSLIGNKPLISLLEENLDRLLMLDKEILLNVVAECCRAKTAVVIKDEKEINFRQILNFGHTIGHAIEVASNFRIPHGKAISKGMETACLLSEKLTGFSPSDTTRVYKILKKAGLDYEISKTIDREQIMKALSSDKKKDGDRINFVLLGKIGSPLINFKVKRSIIKRLLKRVQ